MRAKKHQSSLPPSLNIEAYDCNTRFIVWSESRPDEVHLVDLEENEGRHECSCEDWEFRNGDYFLWQKPYECKHIKACKIFVKAKIE
jgi:hypothetical protein